MEYRLLDKSEWGMAVPLLSSIGQVLPDCGWVSCALDGSSVAAADVLQPAWHGEPVIIDPHYNGKVDFYKLQMPLQRALPKGQAFFVFAPNRKIARLAEGSGMQEVPWTIWKGIA